MTSSRTPSSLPSSAAVFRTTATSLPTNSPTTVDECVDRTPGARRCSTPGSRRCRGQSSSSSRRSSIPSRLAEPRRPRAASPICAANSVLLMSLTLWPAPSGPDVQDRVAVAGQQGRARATASSSPPTNSVDVSGGDVVRTAADGCIERRRHRATGGRGDALRGARAARGVNDQHRTGPHRRQQALSRQTCCTCSSVNTQTMHDVGASADRRRGRSTGCAPSSAHRPAASRRSGRARARRGRPRRGDAPWARPCARRRRTRPESSAGHLRWSIDASAASAAVNTAPSGADATGGQARGVADVLLQQGAGDRREPSRVPPNTAMLLTALLVAEPRLSTSQSRSRGMPRALAQFQGAHRAAEVGA